MKKLRPLHLFLAVVPLSLVALSFYQFSDSPDELKEAAGSLLDSNLGLERRLQNQRSARLPDKNELDLSKRRQAPRLPTQSSNTNSARSETSNASSLGLEKKSSRLKSVSEESSSEGSNTTLSDNGRIGDPSALVNQTQNSRNANQVGFRSRAESSAASAINQSNTPSIEQSELENNTNERAPLYGGQFRGYSILSLMEPAARSSTESLVSLLIESRIQEISLGVLIDGTFGYDPSYLYQVVRRLSENNRRVLLSLYLINGPLMRRGGDSRFSSLFAPLSIEEFEEQFFNNSDLQRLYESLLVKSRQIAQFNSSISSDNRTLFFPMLEDGLGDQFANDLLALTRQRLQNYGSVGRNPCRTCAPGVGETLPVGPLEVHEVSEIEILRPGDTYSLDGTSFRFRGENPFLNSISYEDTQRLANKSLTQGLLSFSLWRHDRQGLDSSSGELPLPFLRNYVSVVQGKREEEISLLREGLEKLVLEEEDVL
jgi:hypothetical protein